MSAPPVASALSKIRNVVDHILTKEWDTCMQREYAKKMHLLLFNDNFCNVMECGYSAKWIAPVTAYLVSELFRLASGIRIMLVETTAALTCRMVERIVTELRDFDATVESMKTPENHEYFTIRSTKNVDASITVMRFRTHTEWRGGANPDLVIYHDSVGLPLGVKCIYVRTPPRMPTAHDLATQQPLKVETECAKML